MYKKIILPDWRECRVCNKYKTTCTHLFECSTTEDWYRKGFNSTFDLVESFLTTNSCRRLSSYIKTSVWFCVHVLKLVCSLSLSDNWCYVWLVFRTCGQGLRENDGTIKRNIKVKQYIRTYNCRCLEDRFANPKDNTVASFDK